MVNETTQSLPYDFNSIMHNAEKSWTIDKSKNTVQAKTEYVDRVGNDGLG